MSTSVGQVHLDVGLNQDGLKREINGLGKDNKKEFQNAGKSLGKSFGGTFSVAFGNMIANLIGPIVKGLGSFIKESIELGSSIAELENVTTTVFPTMSGQVESFSKTAIQQYGLTEMQAKKMIGTLGAMAQAFGYSEKASYDMSASLTGLVGDVASFYNLEHDVAYSKIKAVFTGETESLKELGIVMTQTALDEFALSNGFGKVTKDMSEQEKVALRLAFVTDKLSFAQGDFAKTQHQWANQTRILSGHWDSFKAALGQGFIAVLTPVLQKLTELMGVVVGLTERFRDFILAVTGKSSEASGAGALVKEISDVTVAAADAADTSAGIASSAAKEVKKSIFGFDKLNKLAAPDDEKSESGSASSTFAGAAPALSTTKSEANSALASLDSLKKKLESIAKWTGLDKLWSGINAGIKKIDFMSIRENLISIFEDFTPIAKASFDGLGKVLRSYFGFIGTKIGGLISIAGKVVEIATGGVALFLKEQSSTIAEWITQTSDTLASTYDALSAAYEGLFDALWNALDENSDALERSFANAFESVFIQVSTVATVFTDMLDGLAQGLKSFVTSEEALITEFFSGIISSVTLLSDTVSEITGELFLSIREWWEQSGKRVWDEIVEVFFDLVAWSMRIWNEILKPLTDAISVMLSDLWNESLKPLWDNSLSFITELWDTIKALYDFLKPIIDWLITYVGPILVEAFSKTFGAIKAMIGSLAGSVSGAIDSLKGILKFIRGVFTGDWDTAWEGLKMIVVGVFSSIIDSIKVYLNILIGMVNGALTALVGIFNVLIKSLNGLSFNVPDWVPEIGGKKLGFNFKEIKAPSIPYLAEGGFVRANQPQLAVIGDNKRHGEIVAPEDKMYDIVSSALQSFMGQLIAALNSSGGNNQKANEAMQLIVQIGEETIVNRLIKLINAESRRQGFSVIKA